MPVIEVFPDNSEGNPYRGLIGSDDGYRVGAIRIEPPFTPGADYLAKTERNVGVALRHALTDMNATVLSYCSSDWGGLPDKDRVIETTKNLLDELGRLANKSHFQQYWSSRG